MRAKITMTIDQCDRESRSTWPRKDQCLAMYVHSTGRTFCLRPANHTGDHRGLGFQWNDEPVEVSL